MRRLSQQLLFDLASIPARQASQTLLNLAPFHVELAKRSRAPTLQRHRAYLPARDLALALVRSMMRQSLTATLKSSSWLTGRMYGSAYALRNLEEVEPLSPSPFWNNPTRVPLVREIVALPLPAGKSMFLDDDMEAHPSFLSSTTHRHREGADVTLGYIPLHPEHPLNILNAAVKSWAEDSTRNLSMPGAS